MSDLERESIEQMIKENSSSSSTTTQSNQPPLNNQNSEYPNNNASFDQNAYNSNHVNQMKMFGDMSSMASFIAAAAMAASHSTNSKLNYPMNAIQPSMIAALHQQQQDMANNGSNNTVQAAALAAALKYNSLYNSIDMLNAQKQQNYSTSLAKLMTYCYNKPNDYMQRLMNEQAMQQQPQSSPTQSIAQPIPLQFNNSSKSNRFHPYMKTTNDLNSSILKLHQQQQMTINTNQMPSSQQISPALSGELNKSSKLGSMSPSQSQHSQSPSPTESLSNQSLRNHFISRPSSSLSTDSEKIE